METITYSYEKDSEGVRIYPKFGGENILIRVEPDTTLRKDKIVVLIDIFRWVPEPWFSETYGRSLYTNLREIDKDHIRDIDEYSRRLENILTEEFETFLIKDKNTK